MATSVPTSARHEFQTDDPSLQPIAARVFARERLSFDDAVTLYRSADILAVGWLANHVRERLHGNVAYFNVNRHINPDQRLCCCLPPLCFRAQEGRARRLHHGAGRSLSDRGLGLL